MDHKLYGGIEFGGTKTICAIGDSDGAIITQHTFATTSVDETLDCVIRFFADAEHITALGVGAFGPVNLDAESVDYGAIYNSPKPGWENVAIKAMLTDHFKIPIVIDVDVNCAALGELYHGVAQDVDSFVYLTVGTGIGGGLVIDRQVIHGAQNIEMGHVRIAHEPFDEVFQGSCPFHGDCLEGIASGFAMHQRYGQKAEQITDHAAWKTEATYIGEAVHNIVMTTGSEKIILGGGLMNRPGLIESIREVVAAKINSYITFPDMKSYIVQSSGELNGVLGAIKLASSAN